MSSNSIGLLQWSDGVDVLVVKFVLYCHCSIQPSVSMTQCKHDCLYDIVEKQWSEPTEASGIHKRPHVYLLYLTVMRLLSSGWTSSIGMISLRS